VGCRRRGRASSSARAAARRLRSWPASRWRQKSWTSREPGSMALRPTMATGSLTGEVSVEDAAVGVPVETIAGAAGATAAEVTAATVACGATVRAPSRSPCSRASQSASEARDGWAKNCVGVSARPVVRFRWFDEGDDVDRLETVVARGRVLVDLLTPDLEHRGDRVEQEAADLRQRGRAARRRRRRRGEPERGVDGALDPRRIAGDDQDLGVRRIDRALVTRRGRPRWPARPCHRRAQQVLEVSRDLHAAVAPQRPVDGTVRPLRRPAWRSTSRQAAKWPRKPLA